MARMITLQSSDSVLVDIDFESMSCSQTLTTMLRDLGLDESEDKMVVPLPSLDGETLKKIVEWCNQHKGEVLNRDSENIKEIPEWDKQFLQVDDDTLYKIIMAANYLDIFHLLEYSTTLCANHLDEEDTVENIRARYNIVNDLTEEQAEKIKEDNAWINS